MSKMNPLVKEYTPYMIKYMIREIGFPKSEDELIDMCRVLVEKIIEKVEPVRKN